MPKTHEARKIPIHPRLAKILAAGKSWSSSAAAKAGAAAASSRPYFFCASPSPKFPSGGHHINTKHMNDDLQKLAKSLGIRVGRKNDGLVVHSLRHFFETQAVDAGVPQFVVDAWMGH